jgi:hypothetical protein
MSVLRQNNWLGQQRVDAAHLRALDSALSADFDLLAGSILAGKKALVVTGFDLVTGSAIGSVATSLQVNVAGGILLHADASEAGTIFSVDDDAAVETLNAVNPNVSGGFTANQVNYVGLDLIRSADSDTSDLVMFMDANTKLETPKTVPLARTLSYKFVISTTDFDSNPNVLPLAKVTTDNLNVVTAIADARQLAFRLGSGGSSPDKAHAYPWPQGRNETTASTSFSGGDKAISSLKDLTDAITTRLWEVGGGEFWYSPTADRNVTLVWSGTQFANGENFSWDGTNLTWKGLEFLFDNSTGYFNTIADQTTSSAGLTDLADGECLYVDLDRTQNATGLIAAKSRLSLLGPGSVPGARQVLAWRQGANVFTRGSKYPVGSAYTPASTTSLGVVKLSKAPTVTGSPVVLTDTEKNAASGVATLDVSRNVVATGITRDSAGTLVVGTGANDSAVTVSKVGATTAVAGNLTVAGTAVVTGNTTLSGTLAVTGTSTLTGRLTASAGITITTGGMTISAGGAAITGNSSVTGTLTVSAALTVSAGGASITGGIAVLTGGINISAGGVNATTSTASAVAGSFTASGSSGIAVYGNGSGTAGVGLQGTGVLAGVEGYSADATGIGGWFYNTGTTGGSAIRCDGFIDMSQGFNPIGATNVPRLTLTSASFPSAWAHCTVGSAPAVDHGVNIVSVAAVGTDQFIVRLPFTLANTNFGVLADAQAMTGSSFYKIVVASKSADDGAGHATVTCKIFDLSTSPPTQKTDVNTFGYKFFIQFWY